MISDTAIWTVILLLGLGTYLIRFSFLGLFGGKTLPPWALRHLKYIGVAVFPAIVTPLLLWPAATGGTTDPARLVAAAAAFLAGMRLSVAWALVAGMGTLYLMHYLIG